MARQTAVDRLTDEHKQELDSYLIENNFSGYVYLEKRFRSLGYEISKTSIHRYGQKLEKAYSKAMLFKAFELDEYEQKLLLLYRSMSIDGRKALIARLFYETDKNGLQP